MTFSRSRILIETPNCSIAAAAILDGRRGRSLPDRHPRAGRVEQAHRLVGELPPGDVAIRKPDGIDDRFVQDPHAVVLFQGADQAAHHLDGGRFAWLLDLDHLKPAGQGRVALEIFLVFGPGGGGDRAQFAAGQRRLEQIGGVPLPRLTAGADHRVGFVDEQDDRGRGRLHFVDDGVEAVFEFAFDAGTGLQQAQIERPQGDVLESVGHIARGDPQGKTFDDGRLADPCLAGEDRIVLAAAGENVDDLPHFGVAAEHRIDLSLPCLVGQIRW